MNTAVDPAVSKTPVTPERLMQLAWGYAPPLILEVAIIHRVFDFLDEAGHTAEEVAIYAEGSERGWTPVLNALVAFDFLRKEGDLYRTSPEGSAFLVTTKPSFMGGLIKHTSKQLIPRWLHLAECVKTGEPYSPVNQVDHGESFFEQFVTDIFPLSYRPAQILAQHLELDKEVARVDVLDIAAGSGVWGIALAQSSPHVHVTAVDWSGVLPVTQKHAEKFGLAGRFEYLSGDLLTVEYPQDRDVATLGHILHSEGEERSRALLKKVFHALKPGGTIAIAEFTPNAERTGPPHTLIFAVNMLVNTQQGDTYPFVEVKEWLEDSGFVDVRELACPGPAPLILATAGVAQGPRSFEVGAP